MGDSLRASVIVFSVSFALAGLLTLRALVVCAALGAG